jgi:hypothetical protein
MGMAYAAKKQGKTVPGKGPAAEMSKSMNTKQLKDFASTSTKGLPNKVPPVKGRTHIG